MMEKRKAMLQLGVKYLNGHEKVSINKDTDTDKAVELLLRAAELGSSLAYHNLSGIYYNGKGVSKDKKKAKQYLE
jgi:TPR repeat protein